jgi:archaellum component FlaG (FlaF/FlaG flagellin family)
VTVAVPACVAASADGRSVVSVRGSRALVFDAASLAVIADGVIAAEATAAALLPTRLAMLAPGRLVVHDLPDLATATTVAVPPRTRLIGTLGDRSC